jgi:hypothetical protein
MQTKYKMRLFDALFTGKETYYIVLNWRSEMYSQFGATTKIMGFAIKL